MEGNKETPSEPSDGGSNGARPVAACMARDGRALQRRHLSDAPSDGPAASDRVNRGSFAVMHVSAPSQPERGPKLISCRERQRERERSVAASVRCPGWAASGPVPWLNWLHYSHWRPGISRLPSCIIRMIISGASISPLNGRGLMY